MRRGVAVGALASLVALSAGAQPWPGERARYPLSITSGTPWLEGTSVAVTFDHAAEVAAGRSGPAGSDVTLLRAVDGGLVAEHLVLDTGSAWNQPDTTLWFRLAEPGATDQTFALSLGGADQARRDGARVFLFFDDFEDGTVDRWRVTRTSVPPPGIGPTTAVTHRGRFALVNPAVGAGGLQLELRLDAGFPQDLVLDTWVWMDEPALAQWAWFLRYDSVVDDSYNLGPDTSGGAWRVGQRLAGAYTRYPGAIPFSASPPGRWVRTVASVDGERLSLCVGTECLDGGVAGNPGFTAAGVGFGRLISAADVDAGRRVVVDDVIVRRTTRSPVQVELLERLAGVGEPCGGAVGCTAGECRGVCVTGAVDGGADGGLEDAGVDGGETDGGLRDGGTDAGAAVDGGADAGPADGLVYSVGCGCGAPGAVPLTLALLLAAGLARRRASRWR